LGALTSRRWLKGPVLVAALMAALACVAEASGVLSRIEAATVDWRFRLQRQGDVDPRILMVDVDQQTLDTFGWPMPREYLALLFNAAAHAGAKGAIVDIELVDPGVNPVSDRALSAVLGSLPVALAVELSVPADDDTPGWPRAFEAHPPLAMFSEHAQLGHIQVDDEPDGVARRVPLFIRNAGARVPSLGLAGARFLDPGLAAEERTFPVDRRGFLSVDFRPIPPEQRVSLLALIAELKSDPAAVEGRLKDRLLVVGYSAASAGDRGPLPLGKNLPLVDVHAHTVDTLLHGRALRVAPLWATLLVALLLALALAGVSARMPVGPGALSALALLLGATLAIGLAFWRGRLELAFAAPMLAGVGAFALTQLGVRREGERQARQIRTAFEKYVAPSILRRIMEDPSALNVAGKQAELAILFSDVQGYTALSNRFPPEKVLSLLRTYLDVMSRILLEHEGTIDKIMGDGILAFFGDPIASENPSRQAVACGLAMQRAMTELAAQWEAEGYGKMRIRVGIATGTVYVGNIGSSDHLEYTVIGPAVNLAARLESNAPAGGVLVAESTMRACEGTFAFERLGGLTLKGFGTDYEAFLCKGPKDASGEMPAHSTDETLRRGA
jgi:adenylate cyclase